MQGVRKLSMVFSFSRAYHEQRDYIRDIERRNERCVTETIQLAGQSVASPLGNDPAAAQAFAKQPG